MKWMLERDAAAILSYHGASELLDLREMLTHVITEHEKTVAILPVQDQLIAVLYVDYVSVSMSDGSKTVRMVLPRNKFDRLFEQAFKTLGIEHIVSYGGLPAVICRPRAKNLQ